MCFAKQPNWITRRIAGETILVPLAGNVADLDAIYVLDEVGSRIWDLLDGQRSTAAIAEILCAAYAVGEEEATHDVRSFVGMLRRANLVTVTETPAIVDGAEASTSR
jgi:hypothetical protein